ncbi:MAG TPA: P-II family nitrogen regulator [Nitrosomonas nitrosa]|nr:P-II family nitrogen regulator [Nitrosomonas nitrosa]HNP50176.1 P-II family nitrogen regulator [Nitrosomonas nitrosa]
MKEIRAIIRPSRLSKLRNALHDIHDFFSLTIWKAERFAAPISEPHTLREELTEFTDKIFVSALVADEMVDIIVDIILRECKTDLTHDGVVWVMPVEVAYRIDDKSAL